MSERRVLIAVALSSLVLMAYPAVLGRLYPGYGKTAQGPLTESGSEPAIAPTPPSISRIPQKMGAEQKPETFQKIESASIAATLSDRSAGIQLLVLPQYQDLRSRQPVVVLHAEEAARHTLSLLRPDTAELLVSQHDCRYAGQEAVCVGTTDAGLRITKKIALRDDEDLLQCEISVSNPTSQPTEFVSRVVLAMTAVNGEEHSSYTRPMEAVIVDGKRHSKVERNAVAKKPKHFSVIPTSIALLDRHFCLIAQAPKGASEVTIASTEHHGMQAHVLVRETLAPGATWLMPWALYVGPRDYGQVQQAGESFAEGLRPGFFGQIGLLLLAMLNGLHLLARNYGVAIVLMTVVLSVMLIPFNLMSIRSMQRMRTIQPAVEKLKASCKDNKEKFNREYMELMKKQRVNPLGGCLLPMLVQMPIFFALLQVLSNSIELRGASFLWIKDLSSPDRLAKLPFSLPFLGDDLNILPILTAIAMFLQQKVSQAAMPSAGQDGMPDMSIIMLVMFSVWMYHAPAGSVIYWLVNTAIMVVWFKFALKQPAAA